MISALRSNRYFCVKLDLLASIFLHEFVEPFPQVRDHVELDNLGCDRPIARVNAREVLQKDILGL